MVTIRHRDTMKQERVSIKKVKEIISSEVSMSSWLQKI
jgi:glycyl-tRNA synthetase